LDSIKVVEILVIQFEFSGVERPFTEVNWSCNSMQD